MLWMTLLACSGHAEEPQKKPETMTNNYTRQTRINDVMNDAVFGDYGRLIFPVNTGYWSGTTLEQLALTWYNYIDPDKTVEVCNYLRACATQGCSSFGATAMPPSPFATQVVASPTWEPCTTHSPMPSNYRSRATMPLRSSIVPAMPTKTWPVLSPTSMTMPTSWVSAAQATLSGVAPLAHGWQRHWAIVPIYAHGYTTVSPYDGPTYACCGTSDGIASWRTMQSRLESLSALGIPTEFHSYNGLPHGFGLGTGTVAEGWLQDAVHFWQSQSGATAIRSAKANTRQQDSVYSLNGIRRNTMQRGINIVDRKKIIH